MLVLLGVSPEQIAEQSLVRDVRWPLDHLNVPVVVKFLTQTAVHAQYFVIDECSHRELFEDADKLFEEAAILLVRASQRHLGLPLPL